MMLLILSYIAASNCNFSVIIICFFVIPDRYWKLKLLLDFNSRKKNFPLLNFTLIRQQKYLDYEAICHVSKHNSGSGNFLLMAHEGCIFNRPNLAKAVLGGSWFFSSFVYNYIFSTWFLQQQKKPPSFAHFFSHSSSSSPFSSCLLIYLTVVWQDSWKWAAYSTGMCSPVKCLEKSNSVLCNGCCAVWCGVMWGGQ